MQRPLSEAGAFACATRCGCLWRNCEENTLRPVDFGILPTPRRSHPVRIRALPSVQDDWCAWLPKQKAQIFDEQVQQLESVYMMFSIALNEAIEFRHTGMLSTSYQAVGMTPGLAA